MNHKNHSSGFTLIEVLFALGLIALGMAAAFNTVIDAARNATYLKHRTLAEWVALNQLTELRLAVEAPEVGESDGDIELANQLWRWDQRIVETPVADLFRVEIGVALADEPDARIATVTGFIGPPVVTNTPTSPWLGGPERGAPRDVDDDEGEPPADSDDDDTTS